MQVEVEWIDAAAFAGQTGSGHALVLDGPPEGGGTGRGMRPMELLLLGMAACTAYDVVSMLRKSRQEPDACRVEVQGERAATVPHVFTELRVRFILSGEQLQHKTVARAIRLSSEKYCSASIMLGKTARITHEFEIR